MPTSNRHIIGKFGLAGTQSDYTFIDVNLYDDNALFIDPRLIKKNTTSLGRSMQNKMDIYTNTLINALRLRDANRIKEICLGIKEPKATRLGYSVGSSSGNSMGKKLKEMFIASLMANPVIMGGPMPRLLIRA